MKKPRPGLLILLLIFLSCSDNSYKSPIRRMVSKRCNCFEQARILLSPAVIKVLEQAVDSPKGSDISSYHDLSEQEKLELHQLFTRIYDDSTGKLISCLSNAGEALSTHNQNEQDDYMNEIASSKQGCQMERYYESGAIYSVKMTAICEEIFNQQCNCLDAAGITLSERVKKVLEEAATVPTPGTHLRLYDELSKPEQEELKKIVAAYYENASPVEACFQRGRELEEMVREYQKYTPHNMLLEVSRNRKDCRFPYYEHSEAIYNVATSVLRKFD